jgi:hypothetical protein
VELLLSSGGSIRLFEAHKGIYSFARLRKHLDTFNLTVFFEKVSKLSLSSERGEILHIQVASLLRVLISHHFLELLDFSFLLGEGLLHIPLVGLINRFTMEVFDSSLSTLISVVPIPAIFLSKADKGKGAYIILNSTERQDFSISPEDLSELLFRPLFGEVLHVDIIEGFLEITFVFWSKLLTLDFCLVLGLSDGLSCILSVLKAHKSVSIRLMVAIERNFA